MSNTHCLIKTLLESDCPISIVELIDILSTLQIRLKRETPLCTPATSQMPASSQAFTTPTRSVVRVKSSVLARAVALSLPTQDIDTERVAESSMIHSLIQPATQVLLPVPLPVRVQVSTTPSISAATTSDSAGNSVGINSACGAPIMSGPYMNHPCPNRVKDGCNGRCGIHKRIPLDVVCVV